MDRRQPSRSALPAALLAGALLYTPAAGLAAAPSPPETDSTVLPSKEEIEWVVAPEVSYDSSLGPGLGVFANIAKLDEGHAPYRFRISGQVFFNLRRSSDGRLDSPYQHHYALLDVPGLADGRLRLHLELRFRRQTTAGYYGLGNASVDESPEAEEFHQFARTFPSLRVTTQGSLPNHLRVFAALGLGASWITVYPDSQLALDRDAQALVSADGGAAASSLVGLEPHVLLDGSAGLLWDSRDDEFAPTRGVFADFSFRGGVGLPVVADSSGPPAETPFAYGGANLTVRTFSSLWGGGLTLAVRSRVDLLFGNPPLYALAAVGGLIEDRWATGGGTSIRGVPLQRYRAKIKLQSNIELRARLGRFQLFGRPSRLSILGFVDLARFFADWMPQPALDGSGLGVKVGFGGGLRLRFGRTLIVRADLGVSADGLGGYVDVGHIF